MVWTCVLCSSRNLGPVKFERESSLCRVCKSTWRARAITLTIIVGLGLRPTVLKKLNSDWSRIGIGISDDVQVASRLSAKFSYSNTFFDGFPNLDIRNIPPIAKNSFEFVSCSDVLEHVDVNLDKAVRGLSKLIKPGGFAVLSVPIDQETEKVEFYPKLETFKVTNGVVRWRNHEGRSFVDLEPEFHGGRGQNLAFRQFADKPFRDVILGNGFRTISNGVDAPELGVPWNAKAGVYIARV